MQCTTEHNSAARLLYCCCRAEKTKVGRELSGVFVATLCGLVMSNIGIIPCEAPQYTIVNSYLLPLAIPLLLFSADLQRVLRDTGSLLPIFITGSLATVLSTLIAITVVPLSSLGENGWKIAAALCARHIGGAINYVAVTVGLEAGQDAVSAGLAADNLICGIYFSSLYALARKIPAEAAEPAVEVSGDGAAVVRVRSCLCGVPGEDLQTCSAQSCSPPYRRPTPARFGVGKWSGFGVGVALSGNCRRNCGSSTCREQRVYRRHVGAHAGRDRPANHGAARHDGACRLCGNLPRLAPHSCRLWLGGHEHPHCDCAHRIPGDRGTRGAEAAHVICRRPGGYIDAGASAHGF